MPDSESIARCETSAALENVRRMVAQCHASCERILEPAGTQAIRSVGVIGAGIMGTAIAIEHAAHSIPVILVDKNAAALASAARSAASEFAARHLSARQPIVYTLDESDLLGCDLVLESIVEKSSAKQSLYAQIKPQLSRAILATNTSTIPIGRLAAGLADPGRFCGLHFCHPVRLRPLVEVIAGPATSQETVAAMVAHVLALGKLPLLVGDGPGFVVNRLLLTYVNEALAMVRHGAEIQRVDGAMVAFGMPLGPLELLDEIGLDTALQSGAVLAEIFQERSAGTELLLRLVKGEQLGMKSGSGFYRYPGKTPNPLVGEIVDKLRVPGAQGEKDLANSRVRVEELLRPMLTEAARVLLENKVASAWQIDLAMIFGLGFPLWRGGLLWWAQKHGLANFPRSLWGES